MEIKVLTTFNIDIAAERARLEKSFRSKPEAKARQIALLDAFEALNWTLFGELYDALPEDEEYECPEQEFVSIEITDFLSFVTYTGRETRIVK
jgi:hypothetical protein